MFNLNLAANEVGTASLYNLQLFSEDETEEITEEIQETNDTETEEVANSEVEEEKTEEVKEEPKEEDITKTQAFSRRLNEEREKIRIESETAAVDRYVAKQYAGQLWHEKPITTQKELDQALYEQKMEEAGQDPETVNKLVNEHPDVVSARLAKRSQEQWGQLVADHPEIKDVSQIYPEALEMYDKGIPLLDAYNRVFIKNQKAEINKVKLETEQETIRKINKNATSSPGSAADGAIVHKTKAVSDMTSEEFEAYREEVSKQRRD